MRPQNPSGISDVIDLHKSVYKTLRGNISQGQISATASDGTPAVFTQDNTDGILVRVASLANPLGLSTFWAGDNLNTIIPHNLGRIPIGYYVTKKSEACDVYDGTVVADDQNITLKCTLGSTADTIIYIF